MLSLVLTIHQNAGHVAQAIRPASFHMLTDTSTYHVIAIDYRGFGYSTGSPTETGLIIDGSAIVDWAIQVAGIPASRIVLLGQSLGTAVTSGVAEHFAQEGIDFAGVILVSGFSSLPTMLSHYSIAGYVPVLLPLRAWPWLLNQVLGRVVDKWASADRLRDAVRAVKERGGRLRLSLIHAKNDWDIPSKEDDRLFAAAVAGTGQNDEAADAEAFAAEKERRTIHKGENAFVATWTDGDVIVQQELFPYGGKFPYAPGCSVLIREGHNEIMTYAPVTLAVLRAFDLVGTRP